MNIIDFIETTDRKDEVAHKYSTYEGKDRWWFITCTKTIREDAVGMIWLWLGGSPSPSDGIMYYDGAIAVVEDM